MMNEWINGCWNRRTDDQNEYNISNSMKNILFINNYNDDE